MNEDRTEQQAWKLSWRLTSTRPASRVYPERADAEFHQRSLAIQYGEAVITSIAPVFTTCAKSEAHSDDVRQMSAAIAWPLQARPKA